MEKRTVRGMKFTLAAVTLCGVSALAATGLAYVLRPPQPREQPPPPAAPVLEAARRLLEGRPRPDLAVLVSGEQHGYLLPCGCSRPQYGGLERRYNLLQMLRRQGWPVAAVDLGDVPQREGPRNLPNVQGLIKYRYAMEAMDLMKYQAVGLGEHEAALSLFNVLGEYALNNPTPRVLAANLHDKEGQFPNQVFSALVERVAGSPLSVGVGALVGPSVQALVKDPN